MSGMPDSSPSSGSKKGGGMKNVDGREGGAGWNSDKSKASFSDKAVDSMPNEGAPTLGSKGVIGKVEE